ncbi:Hypothetical_protein [Hexamita inflata]|uniref:Hypothetical_protein n=1 Tax=Hexamita inflata TaxID=28002 RepID=A0AA86N4P5_9EUKA|nr:Hypothetical protein HINF_LOCUS368 [Hexamita inflata]
MTNTKSSPTVVIYYHPTIGNLAGQVDLLNNYYCIIILTDSQQIWYRGQQLQGYASKVTGSIPDIEFQYQNITYVTFALQAKIYEFKGKILKYGGTYGDNRVIPLVFRYNGTMQEKSMNLLTKYY